MVLKDVAQTWADYWNIFDSVCGSLNNRNKTQIVERLKEAQLHVNGLTDGWHEFYDRLDTIIDDNFELFTEDERCAMMNLRNCLNEVLTNR